MMINEEKDLSDYMSDTRISEPGSSNYGDFSQQTKQLIKNGNFVLTGLDKPTASHLEHSAAPKILEQVQDLEMYPAGVETASKPENDNISYNNAFSLYSKTAKLTGLKRRTPRILDNCTKVIAPQKSVLDIATYQLNISSDSTTPQLVDSAGNQIFGDTTPDLTLSQKMIDSQTAVQYLRKREKKQVLESIKENDAFEVVEESVYVAPPPEEQPSEDEPIPVLTRNGTFEENVAAEALCDFSQKGIDHRELKPAIMMMMTEEPEFMVVHIGKNEPKKESEYTWTNEEDSILWTRANVKVPMTVKWHSKNICREKRLRIKFVRWGSGIKLEKAIKDVKYIVKKCPKHIMTETRIPHESFIYAENVQPKTVYLNSYFALGRGYHIEGEIPENVTEVKFDIQFSCKQMDFDVEERRMKLCLVFLLEDRNGNLIQSCKLEEVRIIAYPLRDYRNYLDKKKAAKEKKTNCSSNNKFQTMNPRKRAICENEVEEEAIQPRFAINQKNNNHQARLMLGMSNNTMEVDEYRDEGNENYETVKRFKNLPKPVFLLPIYELDDEIELLEYAAKMAKRKRNNATTLISGRTHPLSLQGQVTRETCISSWLHTMGLKHLQCIFRNQNIDTIGMLVDRYECDMSFLERIPLQPQDYDMILKMFINFYYVYKYEQITTATEQ